MRRRSSIRAKAMPSCSTDRSSTATSAMPRRTTSTPCSTSHFPGGQPKTPAEMPAFFVLVLVIARNAATKQSKLQRMRRAGLFRFARNDRWSRLRPGPAADIDHVAVAGGGILVGEARDQHAAVKGDDLTVQLATGRSGRADIILAATAALDAQFLRGGLVGQMHHHAAGLTGADHVGLLALGLGLLLGAGAIVGVLE